MTTRRVRHTAVALALLGLLVPGTLAAQGAGDSLRVLLVTAHPDDDAAFAATTYRITHHLGGAVDLAVLTDGSGGYRYATLAERLYGLDLTDEAVARAHLPRIRKRELMAGGAIVGIRDYFFFDQYDHGFTLDADTVLRAVWDTALVRRRLTAVMERGRYDLVIGLLPFADTHGGHKAATIMALEAGRSLPDARRPVVLGGFPCELGGRAMAFAGLDDYPITRVAGGAPLVRFDRTQKFGHDSRLDYKIVVNWVIAEHKSQGTMQLLMNRGDAECFWYFDANPPARRGRVEALFHALNRPPHGPR